MNKRTCGVILSALLFSPFFAKALPPISARPDLNEFYSSAFQLPDNRICAVFENRPDFADPKDRSTLYFSCLKDRVFTKARSLQPQLNSRFSYIANPRPLIINGKIWIYFNAFNDQTTESKWGRFAFDENDPETPVEWLTIPESLQGQSRPWIFPALTSAGKVLLAFERKNPGTQINELAFATSTKGRDFSESTPILQGAQMVRFSEFEKGPWIFSFQEGQGSQMKAFVMLSSDEGKTFSAKIPVSAENNVHDTFLLPRLDGGIDVYYLVWMPNSGYLLFRRKVSKQGALGEEQQLTSTAVAVEKPHCLRLASGKIFVTLSQINTSMNPVTTDIVFMTLMDDAE